MSNRGQSNTTAPAIIIGLVAAIITWLLMSSEMVVGRHMSASESQAAMLTGLVAWVLISLVAKRMIPSKTYGYAPSPKKIVKEKVLDWSSKKQADEITKYVAILQSLDAEEIAGALAAAQDFASSYMAKNGIDLYDPITAMAMKANLTVDLSIEINQLQSENNLAAAAPLIIWVHTLRAVVNPELRPHARMMWEQLSRAFPHVEQAAENLSFVVGRLDISRNGEFPKGMTPKPLD